MLILLTIIIPSLLISASIGIGLSLYERHKMKVILEQCYKALENNKKISKEIIDFFEKKYKDKREDNKPTPL